MAKIEKSIMTPKWLEIKKMYETESNGSKEYKSNFKIGGEFDELTREFLDMIMTICEEFSNECTIEGVHMNLWKERIWSVIENGGLLAPIAWKLDDEADELEALEAQEAAWSTNENEFGEFGDYEPTDQELRETESIDIN